ncbi:hypothetical protein HDU87_003357 [Geranomyces variabilis]|uniref:RRM domain-containing protein n=1 Tax=Geranomyces variabilis TaxID=109894 RepID=A0AAD5TK41_9FUNG|nr:hypothetical protein HDU87_003357 [Geranomyces variabilis]
MKRFDPYPFTGTSQPGQMISVSAEREFSGHHYFAYEHPAVQAPSPRTESHWPSPPPGLISADNEHPESASIQADRARVPLPNLPKPPGLDIPKNKIPTSEPGTPFNDSDDADRQSALERAANHSLAMLYQLRPNVPPSTGFAVLKVSNIAWNLSIGDIVAFFAPFTIPVGHAGPYFTQAVHIVMNRATGKTQSECFVEFPTYTDAQRALELHGRGILKGRIVVTQWSTQSELADALFPHRAGHHKEPNVMEHDAGQDDGFGDSGLIYDHHLSAPATAGVFLLREEINALLLVCRNYKLHFSRKCAERPFENIISILAKVPWHQPEAVSTAHRDHLFEMLKLSLESLRVHLSRADHQIDETLMARMVRAGLCVPLFTERQKVTLLNVTQIPCSPDLARFVYNPPQIERSFSATEESPEALSAPADRLAVQFAQVNVAETVTEPEKSMPSPANEAHQLSGEGKYLTPVAGAYSQKSFAHAASATSLYPSPPDADAPSTPTPYGPGARASSLAPASEAFLNDRYECDTPSITASLYASRVRLLEQALRQSEQRYDDLRKRHEAALARANRERQEIINGKLRTEQHCEELEREYRALEEENAALQRQCAALEHRLSSGRNTPGPEYGRDFPFLAYGQATLAGRSSRSDRLDSDTIRSIWN